MKDIEVLDILISGDFCPINRTENFFLDKKYSEIYNDVLPVLKNADIAITNLECPLTNKVNPIKKAGPNLIADPDCINGIKYGGFDVVAIANNHIFDQGYQGLKDTLETCSKVGIHTVGAGLTVEEISKTLYLQRNNKKIAILNFAEQEFNMDENGNAGVNLLHPVSNYYQIIEAKNKADIIIVIIHGGHEFYTLPSPRMVKTYRYFADLGATAVIGHHTHCSSGYEIYNSVPIFYSLGNFIFDKENINDNHWSEGYIVKLTISNIGVSKISLIPYYQYKDKLGIKLMNGDEKNNFLEKINNYNNVIADSSLLNEEWVKFCEKRKMSYIYRLFPINRVIRKLIKKNIFLIEKILNKYNLLLLLDFFRCAAHRDLAIESLKRLIYVNDDKV
ncbi:MAG: hypothetical protein CMG69_03980 [Candidatus Marinimicrobia bacterium]|nr:hypothetical protein [Candidatus Neomarinimicrobiota bacterium]|tara:strand:+ start:42796 stop:43965 length:1170 start_codon:yes stop_codon:yes gene_type:complete